MAFGQGFTNITTQVAARIGDWGRGGNLLTQAANADALPEDEIEEQIDFDARLQALEASNQLAVITDPDLERRLAAWEESVLGVAPNQPIDGVPFTHQEVTIPAMPSMHNMAQQTLEGLHLEQDYLRERLLLIDEQMAQHMQYAHYVRDRVATNEFTAEDYYQILDILYGLEMQHLKVLAELAASYSIFAQTPAYTNLNGSKKRFDSQWKKIAINMCEKLEQIMQPNEVGILGTDTQTVNSIGAIVGELSKYFVAEAQLPYHEAQLRERIMSLMSQHYIVANCAEYVHPDARFRLATITQEYRES